MPVPTTHLFDFLDAHTSCSIERHEIASEVFSALRRSIRTIVMAFRETEDQEAQDIVFSLRTGLSEWLTVPIAFNGSLLATLFAMGDAASVERRWGRDIRSAHEDAVRHARIIQSEKNPLRTAVGARIRELTESGRQFRIYCHSQARLHFESLSEGEGTPIPAGLFLHSVSQYRSASPFHVLVKVGPLRSRGWGSAPDALLTAPRFDTLVQFVWTGCSDEAGFGYDPASASLPGTDALPHSSAAGESSSPALRIGWATTQFRATAVSTNEPGYVPDADEFELFARLPPGSDQRRATLVQISPDHGILYPPHSKVLSFDAASAQSVDHRTPGDSLTEGMFVAIPILDDATLMGLQAEEGQFSRTWKARLAVAYRDDADGLVHRLRSNGINLLGLRYRIEHWCKPATTVIHAPQQMRHFEILVRVLAIDFEKPAQLGSRRAEWWKYAWDEVRRARGEAIQSGFQEQQVEDGKLLAVLRAIEPELQAQAITRDTFDLKIPDGHSLHGHVRFFRIAIVEEGFLAPSGELRAIHELSTINQWRS